MTIVHEGFTSASISGAQSLSCNNPTGTAIGDVLLALGSLGGGAGSAFVSSGWTSVIAQAVSGGYLAVLRRVVDGSEGSSFTLSWGGSAVNGVVGISRFSGVDNTTPIDGTPSSSAGTFSSTHTAPSITTLTDNALVVYCYSAPVVGSYTISGPTERWDISNESTGMLATLLKASHGATAAQDATGPFGNWGAAQIALKPAVVASLVQDVGMVPIA